MTSAFTDPIFSWCVEIRHCRISNLRRQVMWEVMSHLFVNEKNCLTFHFYLYICDSANCSLIYVISLLFCSPRPICPCYSGSSYIVQGWPSKIPPSTSLSMSSCFWMPAPPHLLTPQSCFSMWTKTGRGELQTGKHLWAFLPGKLPWQCLFCQFCLNSMPPSPCTNTTDLHHPAKSMELLSVC